MSKSMPVNIIIIIIFIFNLYHLIGSNDIETAFAWATLALFEYMTDTRIVDQITTQDIHVELETSTNSLESALHQLLCELLFQFHTGQCIIPAKVQVFLNLDQNMCNIHFKGEMFQPRIKHTQRTEVKAITLSNLRIESKNSKQSLHDTKIAVYGQGEWASIHIYVILDI